MSPCSPFSPLNHDVVCAREQGSRFGLPRLRLRVRGEIYERRASPVLLLWFRCHSKRGRGRANLTATPAAGLHQPVSQAFFWAAVRRCAGSCRVLLFRSNELATPSRSTPEGLTVCQAPRRPRCGPLTATRSSEPEPSAVIASLIAEEGLKARFMFVMRALPGPWPACLAPPCRRGVIACASPRFVSLR